MRRLIMLNKIKYLIIIPVSLIFFLGPSCEKNKDAGASKTGSGRPGVSADRTSGKGCIEGDCDDGFGTYVYDDGSIYTGEFKNGKRHGKGRMKWASGARKGEEYEGEWSGDDMHGKGRYVYSDGSVYAGEFRDGKRHGQGVMSWASGPRKGAVYAGDWKDDEINGTGVYTYSDGSVYKGEFKDGKRHGQGSMTWASGPKKGDKYTGEWTGDEINGLGKYVYSDGSIYEGEFKDGKRHGKGSMIWASGKRKGDRYTGDWSDDNVHGIGEYVYADGSVYKGRFNNWKRQGYGVMTWNSGKRKGERYSGEWNNDIMHGTGVYTLADGTKKSGTWVNGKWYGRVMAKNSGKGSGTGIEKAGGRSGKPAKSLKKQADPESTEKDDSGDIPKLFEAEYIYIEKDWSNWYMIYGENLEKFLKNKKLQIEYIDGNAATAKFDRIELEREAGYNRWKKYWKIESGEGVITKVPETSIWRIKIIK